MSLRDQDRHDEAEDIATHVSEERIRALDTDELLIFPSYKNLGSILFAKYNYKGSTRAFLGRFSGWSKVLKSGHPHTLSSGGTVDMALLSLHDVHAPKKPNDDLLEMNGRFGCYYG